MKKGEARHLRIELTETGYTLDVRSKTGAFLAGYAPTDFERLMYIIKCEIQGQQPSKRRLVTGKLAH